VHGRLRNLESLASLARSHGCTTLVAENGAEIAWDGSGVRVTGLLRGVGRLLFDDAGGGPLDSALIRHRRAMARNGAVIAVLVVRPKRPGPLEDPAIHVCGVSLPGSVRDALAAGLGEELRRLEQGREHRAEDVELRSTMTQWLQRELRRRLRPQPAVVAMVTER
jgi:mRNA degradation ribonuclease J1/J2